METRLEVLKLKRNSKTGGLNIKYAESKDMRIVGNDSKFPYRPKISLLNAMRRITPHLIIVCEMDEGQTLTDLRAMLIENEKGILPEEICSFSLTGFEIKVAEETKLKLFGLKHLEIANRYIGIDTGFFIVSDSTEYENSEALSELVADLQLLVSDYINGDYEKGGTQMPFDFSVKPEEEDDDSESEVLMISQGGNNLLPENKTLALEESNEVEEEECIQFEEVEEIMDFEDDSTNSVKVDSDEKSEVKKSNPSKKKSSSKNETGNNKPSSGKKK